MRGNYSVGFIGTLPPPVTGMTLATGVVVDELSRSCELQVCNISHEAHYPGARWKFMKGLKSLYAIWQLARWPRGRISHLYTVANARRGLWYNIAQVAVARMLGYRVFVHHQVYSYVNSRDYKMALLNRLVGRTGTHIMLCQDMVARFKSLYRCNGRFHVLPNALVLLSQVPTKPNHPGKIVTLGHISNLTMEKGLHLVIETFEQLRARDLDVRLVLAGPAFGAREKRLLAEAQAKFGRLLDYRGPLYGEEKWKFYRDIDVLVFPTMYANEAYPLVVAESLFCGVPVVAYARACIASVAGDTGGLLIDLKCNFTASCVPTIEQWIKQPQALAAAQKQAWQRGLALRSEARRQLNDALAMLCPGEPGFGAASVTAGKRL